MKFRKKPIVIDAFQWYDHEHTNPTCPRDWVAVRNFMHQELKDSSVCGYCNRGISDHGWIDTLEGGHIVCPADWIIKGINGEYYTCKPDIFRKTYEPVEDENG